MMDYMWRILAYVCLVEYINLVQCQQLQSFAIEPNNTDVWEGQAATLFCKVENQAGQLQWTKEGFGMGYNRSLPDYPRYTITGDESLGEGHLHIVNATLGDDGVYQCQISAAEGNNFLNSHPAKLNVLVSPEPPYIQDYANGSKVTVTPPQTILLTCKSDGGKPAPALTWLQEGGELIYDTSENSVERQDDKRETAVSVLTLNPERVDNGMVFTCVMNHPLLPTSTSVSVTLNVQFAPEDPIISGYTTGEAVVTGESVALTCTARGGNPLPEVTWWRNGDLVDYSYFSNENEGIATNELEFIISHNDNGAEYTCEVKNVVTTVPLRASFTLTVHFLPAYVNITGSTEVVKAGDTIMLTCTSANSNPPVSISWMTAGQLIGEYQDVVTPAPGGGFITSQNLTVAPLALTNSVTYTCQATNQALLETVSDTITLSVQYPPEAPYISGFNDDNPAQAGNLLRLTCVSVGGNPRPTLTWTRDGVSLKEGEYDVSGNLASSELTIITSKEDNGMVYGCQATNPATTEPLTDSVTLNVQFSPDDVSLTLEPETATEGDRVVVTCLSSSSNPASEITWWRNGLLNQGIDNGTVEGENGGMKTKSLLIIDSVDANDDEAAYLCRATNPLLGGSANDAVTLSVYYAPRFLLTPPSHEDNVEWKDSFVMNCSAVSKPFPVTYTWHKNGLTLNTASYTVDGGALIIKNVTRNDAGTYVCYATNSQGSNNLTVVHNVQYSPTLQVNEEIVVNIGTTSYLECGADANPAPDGYIHWTREGYNITGYPQVFKDGKSILTLKNVSKDHAGPYICTADNGIEPKATKVVQIIVEYKPVIEKSPQLSKAASAAGKTAKITCRAEGAPIVHFTWYQFSKEVNLSNPRYSLELSHKTYSVNYESILTIKDVNEAEDFGSFTCKAYNDLGADSYIITLESIGAPDPPAELQALEIKYNSVTLSWIPGFDGGLPQSFRIRFNIKGDQSYQYVDIEGSNTTNYTVNKLQEKTQYEFNIRGSNSIGDGDYMPSPFLVTTIAIPSDASDPTSGSKSLGFLGGIPIYAIILAAGVFLICLILNLVLLACLIKRKRNKRKKVTLGDKDTTELYQMKSTERNNVAEDHQYEQDVEPDDGFVEHNAVSPEGEIVPITTGFYSEASPPPVPPPPRLTSYGSWDSVAKDGTIYSEPQTEEEEYAETLRRKQQNVLAAAGKTTPASSNPEVSPANLYSSEPHTMTNLGNYVPLKKGSSQNISRYTPSIADSSEGHLV